MQCMYLMPEKGLRGQGLITNAGERDKVSMVAHFPASLTSSFVLGSFTADLSFIFCKDHEKS